MDSYHLADEILQHSFNAFVGFLLFSFVTTKALKWFKIRNFRLRASLRFLPIVRLALAPLFWLIPSSLSLINASIFTCSHPVQRYLFGKLPEQTQAELHEHGLHTLTGKFLLKVPESLLILALGTFLGISLFRLGRLLIQWQRSKRELEGIQKRGRPYRGLAILSHEIDVPLAGWGKVILIPEKLAENLTQSEFEAVIKHEMEHLKWRDNSVRLLSKAVAAFYWWIPMKKWLKNMNQEQELASDQASDGLSIASALHKTAKSRTKHLCTAFAGKEGLGQRVQTALSPKRVQSKFSAIAGTTTLAGILPLVRFVIC